MALFIAVQGEMSLRFNFGGTDWERLMGVKALMAALALAVGFGAMPASAFQSSSDAVAAADADLAPVGTVDPNAAMQGDGAVTYEPGAAPAVSSAPADPATPAAPSAAQPAVQGGSATTYSQEDVLTQAENVFGRGAEGLARMIQNIFAENGEPNAYIVGREAGGAIAIGLRYGSGTLFHKLEGEKPIYWTGPSVGFDLGADASKTFTLVYNLFDTEEIYRRYPAVEGKVYIIGGFTANYLARGDGVLGPVELGGGWGVGANVGYMNFTKKSKILPF